LLGIKHQAIKEKNKELKNQHLTLLGISTKHWKKASDANFVNPSPTAFLDPLSRSSNYLKHGKKINS
jgi:hypothetical protein